METGGNLNPGTKTYNCEKTKHADRQAGIEKAMGKKTRHRMREREEEGGGEEDERRSAGKKEKEDVQEEDEEEEKNEA